MKSIGEKMGRVRNGGNTPLMASFLQSNYYMFPSFKS